MIEERDEDAAIMERLIDALSKSMDAMGRGDDVEALYLLRSAPVPKKASTISSSKYGVVEYSFPPAVLIRRAAEAYLSLKMGQWGDSPRHSPDSNSPHGFLTMHESLSPILPEPDHMLRMWMNRLRVTVASDHGSWPRVAAWALDMHFHGQETNTVLAELDGLTNLAVAMANLGYHETADALYRRVLGSDQLGNVDRAGIFVRLGSLLWTRGERTEAERLYSEAVALLLAISDLRLSGAHELVRALQRRSDCLLKRGVRDKALRDVNSAFIVLDQARPLGAYEAVRSVDAAVVHDIEMLLHRLSHLEITDEEAPIALGALCRLANSSAAAAARAAAGGPSPAVVEANPDRAARWVRSQLGARWSAVADSDIEALLTSQTPVLVVAITLALRESVRGISIIAGAGCAPKVHHWQLEASTRPDAAFTVLTELLNPPPGSAVRTNDPWSLPWHADAVRRVAEIIVPIEELSSRLRDSGRTELRILPIGRMWRFPYAAIPIDGSPLGALVPIVLTTGASANLPAPNFRRWAGHFDLSLPNAVTELCNTFASTRVAGIDFDLFSTRAELASIGPISNLVFAGHGVLGRGQQQLKLACGERCTSLDLSVLAPGASVLLNACWTGTVIDDVGADPADLALSLIGEGAHSVLGAIGPVADTEAGEFLTACMHALIAGASVAVSAHQAIRARLTTDPDLPLSAWACYTTIGRRASFSHA